MFLNRLKYLFTIFFLLNILLSQKLIITSPQDHSPIDEEILIQWNSTYRKGVISKITIKYQKVDSNSPWESIDEVNVVEGEYFWILDSELRNYKGEIKIKIFSNDILSAKDEVIIGEKIIKMELSSKTPMAGSKLNISWNAKEPVQLYYAVIDDRKKSDQIFIDNVGYGKNSYDWIIPVSLSNKRINIEVKLPDKNVSISSELYVKKMISINVFIDKKNPKVGDRLFISWDRSGPIKMYCSITGSKRTEYMLPSSFRGKKYRMQIPNKWEGESIRIEIVDADNEQISGYNEINVLNSVESRITAFVDKQSIEYGDKIKISWNHSRPIIISYRVIGSASDIFTFIYETNYGKNYSWIVPINLAGETIELKIADAFDDKNFDIIRYINIKEKKKTPLKPISINSIGYLTITVNNEKGWHAKIKGLDYPLTLPLAMKKLNIGTYEMKMYKKGYVTKKETFFIFDGDETQYSLIVEKKSNDKAVLYSSLYPGVGQIYSDNLIKGLSFMAISTGITGLLINSNMQYNSLKTDVNTYRNAYESATSLTEIEASWKLYKSKADELNSIQDRLIGYSLTLISTWLLNIVDSYLFSGL